MLKKLKVRYFFVIGGFALAFNAGFINSIAVLGSFQQGVSHLTGAVTVLGIDLVKNFEHSLNFLAIIFSFFIGSMISGLFLESVSLRIGRRYGILLMLESILLGISTYLILEQDFTGIYFASCACGLQNAMATTYSGAILRTTHLTGVITDLGIFVGNLLRRKKVDKVKFLIYCAILIGFFFGAVIGTDAFNKIGISALYGSSFWCGIFGLSYFLWRHLKY